MDLDGLTNLGQGSGIGLQDPEASTGDPRTALPGTYRLDRDRTIRFAFVNAD